MRHWLFLLATGLGATASSRCFAQASETDRSLAESLFEQGKQLMDASNYAQACPKLQESQRLDPGGGTLLNLALCHERQGRIASAWTEYKEALGMARRDGRQERIDAAIEHIAALEPKLPYLTLTVPNAVEGEEVKLDGAVVGSAAWGAPLTIDPGTHELTAKAPGKKPWSVALALSPSEKRSVSVPTLEPAEAPAAVASPPATPVAAVPQAPALRSEPKSNARSAAGWVIGGAGVVAIGAGSYFGLQTISKRKESTKLCPTDDSCIGDGVKLNKEAYTNAWLSDIGFGVGVIALGVGTYLLLSGTGAAEKPATNARRAPALLADGGPLPGGGKLSVSVTW